MQSEQEFPALYQAADLAATKFQTSYLRIHFWISWLLIIAAGCVTYSGQSKEFAILNVVFFLFPLGLSILNKVQKYQAKWYQARALAESIKTSTWRLAMSADPFHNPDESVNISAFESLLSELLTQNKSIGENLAIDVNNGNQITQEMTQLVRSSYSEKRERYLNFRIEDQWKWYSKKSILNRKTSRNLLIILCCCYGIAIILLLVRLGFNLNFPLPIEIFAVAASSLLGWGQMKRFDELAGSYALTSHEIGIIKSKFNAVSDASTLSSFVADSENAFSREHTQWAARRDH